MNRGMIMNADNGAASAISVALVEQLIVTQFPQWAELPIRPVLPGGWDNRTFRLGEQMSVRLPSAAGYVLQVAKEQRWLPVLGPLLPLPVPVPLAMGAPSDIYPWPWSVYRWLEGEPATRERIADLVQFACSLAHFLTQLQQIDAAAGPAAGAHNCYRGSPLEVYDAETRRALISLRNQIDTIAAQAVWETALQSPYYGPPVWVHGDVAAGNLLVNDGQLSAVIDFGCMGVGDPACDLVIAWTLLSGPGRAAFRDGLPLESATWARARGWAVWKALITLVEYSYTDHAKATAAQHVLAEVLADGQLGE